jgi:8-oxo-dGTP pyrophosphatase MutT (NUDIX family)
MIANFIAQKTVIRHSDGTYLILRRSDTDTQNPLEWDLPGGMIDQGETLESGAMREIVEEVGGKLAIIKFLPRFTQNAMTKIKGENLNYLKIIYVALATKKDVQLSFEHDMYEWVEGAEFIKRFASQPRYHKAVRYIIDNKLDVLA